MSNPFSVPTESLWRPCGLDDCGAGGIRTLVQTWYKVSFLHAYLLFNCREGEGQPRACTVFLSCFVSSCCRNAQQDYFRFSMPRLPIQQNGKPAGQKLFNSKLSS